MKLALGAIASRRTLVIVMDFKGDTGVYWALRSAAERYRLSFKHLSTLRRSTSFVFNPIAEIVESDMTPDELGSVLGSALGLVFNREYGKGYFADLAIFVLMLLIRKEVTGGHNTFRYLARRLMDPHTLPLWSKGITEVEHVRAIFAQLGNSSSLNALPAASCPSPEFGHAVSEDTWNARLRFGEMIRSGEPGVVYVHLPAPPNKMTAIMVGQMVAGLISHELFQPGPGESGLRVLLLVDEAQFFITPKTMEDLQQIRTRGMAAGLFYQHDGQLTDGATDRAPLLDNYAGVQIDLVPTTRDDIEELQFFGGNRPEVTASYPIPQPSDWNDPDQFRPGHLPLSYRHPNEWLFPPGTPVNVTEQIRPRWSSNAIMDMAARGNIGFIRSALDVWPYFGGGLAKALTLDYPMSFDEFDDVSKRDWPEPTMEAPEVTGFDWMSEMIRDASPLTRDGPRPRSVADDARRRLRDDLGGR